MRAAIGDPSVEVKIKKISEWQINHVVASRYRQGRLFLAGDAAHRHPPANGLGSNTSIQDSYNLAWKLALVLAGKADDRLLDSYSAERQPVGRRVIDRANRSVCRDGRVPEAPSVSSQASRGRRRWRSSIGCSVPRVSSSAATSSRRSI